MKLNIDLHVHTHLSACALLKPEEIEPVALKRGLDAVAVTDHNCITGAFRVKEIAKTIDVIIAEEIRTTHGEIIGYFLSEHIPAGLSPRETIQEIRRQNGLTAVPHPFDQIRSSRLNKVGLKAIAGEIDMIEIFNSRDIRRVPDTELLQDILRAGAVPIVASDAHLKTEIGRSFITIDAFGSPQEFLKNLPAAQQTARKSPLWVHLVTKLIKPYKRRKLGV